MKSVPLEVTMMKIIGELKAENARLKAEVEHLMIFCNCTLIPNKELQAKVERLTKAGDAMASSIQFNEEMSQDYNGPTIVHQSVQNWHAAKKGKQP
jgi:hypothetical protein